MWRLEHRQYDILLLSRVAIILKQNQPNHTVSKITDEYGRCIDIDKMMTCLAVYM